MVKKSKKTEEVERIDYLNLKDMFKLNIRKYDSKA